MKYIGIVFSSIWRLWFFLVFLTVFIVLIPPLYFYTRIIPNQKIVCNITRLWSRLTLFFSGIFLNVKYEEEINKNENYIICPNHISTIDIPVVLAALKLPIIFWQNMNILKFQSLVGFIKTILFRLKEKITRMLTVRF